MTEGVSFFSYLKNEYSKEELEDTDYCLDLFIRDDIEYTITLCEDTAKRVINKYFETVPLSNE
ncbi:hypothetical protein [Bacillus multifaciens]|uniref:hypothetical protein n=1 Tax=Bacillus multifaciens TaxID=3068506 RepID=UPI0027414C5D|nr:hypothetical protein [Bacillus sp. WLY-B-L8]MDP7977863.1 hypothetical protein [Bacillus sp. WLY-B-L8]